MTGNAEPEDRKEFIAGPDDVGVRIDVWLAARMPAHISRTRLQDLIRNGHLKLNGQIFSEPKRKLAEDDIVSLIVPAPVDAEPLPQAISLDILHEDEDIIVINKPAGMVVHPAPGNSEGTLVNALLNHCGDSLKGIGGVRRPGIVHRLDKETSGVLVVAKTALAHADLSAQFADHGRTRGLERIYNALVWGTPEPASGRIDTFLGRSPTNRLKRAVVSENSKDAKRAITHYRVISKIGQDKKGQPLTCLLECRLETGRTHQIRVHLSHIGHPLIADELYGRHYATKTNRLCSAAQAAIGALEGQALHAGTLAFEHPASGKTMKFESPLPEKFTTVIDTLSRSCKNRGIDETR